MAGVWKVGGSCRLGLDEVRWGRGGGWRGSAGWRGHGPARKKEGAQGQWLERLCAVSKGAQFRLHVLMLMHSCCEQSEVCVSPGPVERPGRRRRVRCSGCSSCVSCADKAQALNLLQSCCRLNLAPRLVIHPRTRFKTSHRVSDSRLQQNSEMLDF